jgi:FkbM family methyltransferase
MIGALLSQMRVYRGILGHPLNKGTPVRTTLRWLRWHVGSRLADGPIAVPFIDGMRLMLEPGMTGATQNHYCGLAEPADMSFLLHAMRPGDLFLDVGGNVGVYSLLAAAAGAEAIVIEAYPPTAEKLARNIRLNDLSGRVEIVGAAVGDKSGELSFTTGEGPMNHVAAGESADHTCIVPVRRLDEIVAGRPIRFLKLDVEGYEVPALRGAAALLASPDLMAIVVELNGSGERYGFSDQEVAGLIEAQGFRPMRYDPFTRLLSDNEEGGPMGNNSLYARDKTALQARLTQAPRFRLGNGLTL